MISDSYKILSCIDLADWDHERSEEEARKMLEVEVSLLAEVGDPDLYS